MTYAARMRGAGAIAIGVLLALCACEEQAAPFEGSACTELALEGAPPSTIALLEVRQRTDATLVLWRGWEPPDDRLLLSVRDARGWHAPLVLRAHAPVSPPVLGAHHVLLATQDEETREPYVADAGVGFNDSFETQLTRIDERCNELAPEPFRASMYLSLAMTGDGEAAAAWYAKDQLEA